jgi:large subunit ribosomal protein L7/L12
MFRGGVRRLGGGFAAAPRPARAATARRRAEEEQTEFDVVLQSAGEKKIQVIKVVRAARASA